MNNLPKAKRDHLILVAIATVGIIAALLLFVGDSQNADLKRTQLRTENIRTKLNQADKLSREEPQIQERLQKVTKQLAEREMLLAPERDTYAWFLQTLGQFLSLHRGAGVTSAGISQPEIGEATLLPKFVYKTATFHIKANGYFHDIGRFIADLESQFPYARVQNVEMQRGGGGPTAEAEKLASTFDIVMLMQPPTPVETR
jgi:Tfp pilus assembly protein PilO